MMPHRRSCDSIACSSSRARFSPASPLFGLFVRSLSTRRSAASTRSCARSRSARVYWRGSGRMRFFRRDGRAPLRRIASRLTSVEFFVTSSSSHAPGSRRRVADDNRYTHELRFDRCLASEYRRVSAALHVRSCAGFRTPPARARGGTRHCRHPKTCTKRGHDWSATHPGFGHETCRPAEPSSEVQSPAIMTFADFQTRLHRAQLLLYALRSNYCGGGRAHDCHDDECHPA
jgi:hypothetical protein